MPYQWNFNDINNSFVYHIQNNNLDYLNLTFTNEYNDLLTDLQDWLLVLQIVLKKRLYEIRMITEEQLELLKQYKDKACLQVNENIQQFKPLQIKFNKLTHYIDSKLTNDKDNITIDYIQSFVEDYDQIYESIEFNFPAKI